MKRFDTFGEYMFDLLFAPLKKGKRAVNQFYILFKVVGRVFDGLKKDALRIRDETNIVSASSIMLPVHGQDRNMPRLAGESVEGYRTRLCMKGVISKWSGTQRGILYVLTALGYEHSRVEPFYLHDLNRWAEFIVYLGVGNKNAVRNFFAIFHEIQRIKEGSSKLACIVFTTELIRSSLHIGGGVGAQPSIGVPLKPDVYDFQGMLRSGGTGGLQFSIGIWEDTTLPDLQGIVHTGGGISPQTAIPVLEHTEPPSRTTILRTGGVCTIISNLSKGD